MIKLRATKFQDYGNIDIQPYQKVFTDRDLEQYYKKARLLGEPKTAIVDSTVVAIADIIEYEDGYLAWCMVAQSVKNDTRIARDYYRRIKRTLELYRDKPIYAHVHNADVQAIRMAEKLGFVHKELLLDFFGGDYYLYVKAS